jgi:hypothetical protein
MVSGLSILMVLAAITLVVQLWDGAGKRLGASAPRE